jgi:hypothetical protein
VNKYLNINKAIVAAGIIVSLLGACQNQEGQIPADVINIPNTADGEAEAGLLPAITFEETTHDFGKVIQGEVVGYYFRFKNTGKSDLIIANVSASCGCTATKYPTKPVKPGEEDTVQVTFDSSGRRGFQHKTVTIASNTQPNTTVISIKANVIIPERE